jgi:hypothetical protein
VARDLMYYRLDRIFPTFKVNMGLLFWTDSPIRPEVESHLRMSRRDTRQ